MRYAMVAEAPSIFKSNIKRPAQRNLEVHNPLKWWWNRRGEYPVLWQMAFDIPSIPATSAELERAYSQSKRRLLRMAARLEKRW